MKKALCTLFAVALMLSLAIVPVDAAEDCVLELRGPDSTTVGESFTVELYLSGNPGFSSAQLTLGYNSNVLRCTQCSTGELLSDMLSAVNCNGSDGAAVAAAGAVDSHGDGILASFTFEVIASGNCDFELKNVKLLNSAGEALSSAVGTFSLTAAAQTGQTATPAPTDEPAKIALADIEGHRAEDSIAALAQRGIVEGYPDGTYRPDAPVTRAQFVTALWRAMGSMEPQSEPPFRDLSPTGYYRTAVAWAAESGIVRGVGDELFKTHGHISRQEAAAMLHRGAGSPVGGELMFSGIYDGHFADSDDLAHWAKDAVYWAVYEELWCGIGSGEYGEVLGGRQGLTRGEMAVMLAELTR